MIYNCFSVYDEKAQAFLPPFILPKIAQAERAFSDCVNSEDHQFGQHPSDYTLFRLGTFNDEDGQFLLERSKQSLGNGVEFIRITDDYTATEGLEDAETDPSVTQKRNDASILPSTSSSDSPESVQ